MIELRDYQLDAISRMKNGCILCGGVGSGKSRTSLAYYFTLFGGNLNGRTAKSRMMKDPSDLYIITTAKKRDSLEWEEEMRPFDLTPHRECSLYSNKVVVDSWNNVKKYVGVSGAFFIFDEQRLVGKGTWVRSFLKIVRTNKWVLLTATPGDNWMDYCAVFIANGFYKGRSDFCSNHVVWRRISTFYQVERYVGLKRLEFLRNQILINMDFTRDTNAHHINVYTAFDNVTYKYVMKSRWNIWEDRPIENASELCYICRKIVNTNESRGYEVLKIFARHLKVIIFYNFDYELEILKGLKWDEGTVVAEWNGHKHQPVPRGNMWVYLVQYTAGAEGWNCIDTDTIIFFSQNYSYKTMVQASGRIDRMNTPFKDLYYYHLKSHSRIDMAIERALTQKKKFNENKFVKW